MRLRRHHAAQLQGRSAEEQRRLLLGHMLAHSSPVWCRMRVTSFSKTRVICQRSRKVNDISNWSRLFLIPVKYFKGSRKNKCSAYP